MKKKRGRTKKFRVVRQDPKISQFSPRGRPGRPDESELTKDELEAVRLADFIGMSQKEAARSMRVSQQTFSRIIRRARKLIADGLVGGKIIRIQGGSCVIRSEEQVTKSQGTSHK
ncbi:MAG: hypothetical protein DRP74_02140 [Candidatus Omnitrophota bacterium]|nr:MAG: hypothetical protein DRP74_02140 [Candidatus Omnitrophota bacterium]